MPLGRHHKTGLMGSVKKKKSQSPSRPFKKHCELGFFFPPLKIYYVNGSYCHKILMLETAEGKKIHVNCK